jgi:hypothetical protein
LAAVFLELCEYRDDRRAMGRHSKYKADPMLAFERPARCDRRLRAGLLFRRAFDGAVISAGSTALRISTEVFINGKDKPAPLSMSSKDSVVCSQAGSRRSPVVLFGEGQVRPPGRSD